MLANRLTRQYGHGSGFHTALTVLVLLALWASVAAGLWADSCGSVAAPQAGPSAPTDQSLAADQSVPGPACEVRALPARPAAALTSVVEALPAAPALALGAAATLVVAPLTRDTVPTSRVVAPLQHPPNLAG